MHLLTLMFLLAAILDQSLGQDEEDEEDEEDDVELPGSGVHPNVQQEIVDRINDMRRKVTPTATNMLKVIWNETVGENARKWADNCIPHSSPLEQRTFGRLLCGQTISQADAFSTWEEIIDYWQEKSAIFKYGVGSTKPRVNIHSYTQAIWYNSYMVGCGASYCPNNRFPYLYICQYCPAGNIMGLIPTPYNEGPSCGQCRKHCDNKLCTNPCTHVDLLDDCDKRKAMMGCKKANKKGQCKATCKCKNKIK